MNLRSKIFLRPELVLFSVQIRILDPKNGQCAKFQPATVKIRDLRDSCRFLSVRRRFS